MTKKTRKNFSSEFRLETAQLVVDHGYTHEEAAKAMNVGFSTIGKWVKQLREERKGKVPTATPMTLEQLKIQELEKKIARIELEKDILKKASANLLLLPKVKESLAGRVEILHLHPLTELKNSKTPQLF